MSAETTQVSVFRNIERKIGGFMEGAFGRTFRSSVQPVELARKLAKEMDDHRTISIHRVYVPNQYTVHLNPTDREQFAAYEAQMSAELEEYLVEHARREGYSISTRPLVRLETEDDLAVGMFGISVATGEEGGAPQSDDLPEQPAAEPAPAVDPVPMEIPDLPPPPVEAVAGATMIYAADPPARSGAEHDERALLQWEGQSLALTGSVTTIGRSSDCPDRAHRPQRVAAPRRDPAHRRGLFADRPRVDQRHRGERAAHRRDGAHERGRDRRGPDPAHVRAPPWLSSYCSSSRWGSWCCSTSSSGG